MASEYGCSEGATHVDGPAAACGAKLWDRGEERRLTETDEIRFAGDARGEERADDDEKADEADRSGHHDAEDEHGLAKTTRWLRLHLRRVEDLVVRAAGQLKERRADRGAIDLHLEVV